MKHIVGIDIGGSAIKGGYFDGDQLKGTNRVPTFAFKGASTVYRQIFSCVNGLLNSYGEIDAIGVVSAGDMGEDGTFVKVNNIPVLVGMNVKKRLEEDFHCPVVIENDAVGALVAEATRFPEAKRITMLTFGTGLGCATLEEGKILHDEASDYGHKPLIEGGRVCPCGKRGCAEMYLNTASLKRLAFKAYGRNVSTFDLFEKARHQDTRALEVVDQYGTWLRLLLKNVENGLHPDRLILGGGIMGAKDIFEPRLGLAPNTYAFASFGNDAGIMGARMLVLKGENK